METNYRLNNLSVRTIDIESTSKSNVIIVGNAYGVMPYISPLANRLAEFKMQPFWFAFSGQENTLGKYSYSECTNDISMVVDYVKKLHPTKPLHILAHCAGSLMTLEYLKNSNNKTVEKLIIYGLLYAMDRRRNIAERKLKQCHVNYDLSNENWAYKPLDALSKTSIPVLFCHSKDKLNLDRASASEMLLSFKNTPNSDLKWFDEGYDENLENIEHFLPEYINFLNN